MEFRDCRRWPKDYSRERALKTYVMSCIADDYEEFSEISSTVSKWAEEDGLHFDREAILDQLSELIRGNEAQAYNLSSRQPHVVPVDFSEGSTENVWFMLTPSGIEALAALEES